LLVVEEDCQAFGLWGEIATHVLQSDIPVRFERVCMQTTIPYVRNLEDQILSSVARICAAGKIRYL
jgi:pyruvate/2-oxoglutarate/acetoin dehydrogenase E1 component